MWVGGWWWWRLGGCYGLAGRTKWAGWIGLSGRGMRKLWGVLELRRHADNLAGYTWRKAQSQKGGRLCPSFL